jgi:hypothetical protein
MLSHFESCEAILKRLEQEWKQAYLQTSWMHLAKAIQNQQSETASCRESLFVLLGIQCTLMTSRYTTIMPCHTRSVLPCLVCKVSKLSSCSARHLSGAERYLELHVYSPIIIILINNNNHNNNSNGNSNNSNNHKNIIIVI